MADNRRQESGNLQLAMMTRQRLIAAGWDTGHRQDDKDSEDRRTWVEVLGAKETNLG